MNTITTITTTRFGTITRAAAISLLIGFGAAACGSDDSVTDDVSQAADKVEEAEKTGDEKDVAAAEAALEKADDTINDRLKQIVADFDGAEAKIADDAKDAYVDYRTQLADLETSVVAAITATADKQSDAWQSAADKAKDLEAKTADADTKLDGELRTAVTKLRTDLTDLVTEIEKGLS